jgi:hypothetical protein
MALIRPLLTTQFCSRRGFVLRWTYHPRPRKKIIIARRVAEFTANESASFSFLSCSFQKCPAIASYANASKSRVTYVNPSHTTTGRLCKIAHFACAAATGKANGRSRIA